MDMALNKPLNNKKKNPIQNRNRFCVEYIKIKLDDFRNNIKKKNF